MGVTGFIVYLYLLFRTQPAGWYNRLTSTRLIHFTGRGGPLLISVRPGDSLL